MKYKTLGRREGIVKWTFLCRRSLPLDDSLIGDRTIKDALNNNKSRAHTVSHKKDSNRSSTVYVRDLSTNLLVKVLIGLVNYSGIRYANERWIESE